MTRMNNAQPRRTGCQTTRGLLIPGAPPTTWESRKTQPEAGGASSRGHVPGDNSNAAPMTDAHAIAE